jgi:AraC-like DNA-binding protein
MDTLNIDIVSAMFKDLYPLFPVTFCALDNNGFSVYGYPNLSTAPFCCAMRNHPTLNHLCRVSDHRAVSVSQNQNDPYMYTCHAGLTEIIVPVRKSNLIIGYLKCGQFAVESNLELINTTANNYESVYQLSELSLTNTVDTIRIFSEELAMGAKKLLAIMAENAATHNKALSNAYSLPYEINSYIESHIGENVSIETIAKHFNISHSKLYNICKKINNCSVKEYIITRKLERAKTHLINGYSVEDTAECVGIDDTNYFIRLFKSKVGITPKQFQLAYEIK